MSRGLGDVYKRQKEIIESGLEDEKIYEYELCGKIELLFGGGRTYSSLYG